MDELSDRDKALVLAITQSIKGEMSHSCAFDSDERHILHEFIDAVKKEKADGETHIIVLRIGNNVRDAVKKLGQWAVWIAIGAIAVGIWFLIGKPWFRARL